MVDKNTIFQVLCSLMSVPEYICLMHVACTPETVDFLNL